MKSGPLFTPDQFISIIRTAKKKGNPYAVTELAHNDFIDIKELTAAMGTNFIINENGESVLVSKIKMVKVEKDVPFSFFYKNSYSESDEEWKLVDIRHQKKSTRTLGSANNVYSDTLPALEKAYKTKLPLNDNKKKDLKFLLEKNFIPSYYQNFYNLLF